MLKLLYHKYALLIIYLGVLFLVCIGLTYGYGFKHINKVLFYALFFLIFYFLIKGYLKNKNITAFKYKIICNKLILDYSLLLFIILFVIIHLIFLNNIPCITAWKTLDYYKIAFIRQSINEHNNVLIKYISSFMIKGIIPFAVLYFYTQNKKSFYIILPVAIFYSLALMQKSLIITILIPLIVWLILNKQFVKSLILLGVSIVGMFFLVYTTNPNLRATSIEINEAIRTSPYKRFYNNENFKNGGFIEAGDAVYTRFFLTTGLVAGHWFEKIPSQFPYAKGCGYHFLAPLMGCNFNDYDYSKIIYNAVYLKEKKIGLKGTVTVASFVYDYANFGYYGLIVSAFLLAMLINLLNIIFLNNYKWNVSLNFLFIFWLSSGALSTLLFSGGWLITILLFVIYVPAVKD